MKKMMFKIVAGLSELVPGGAAQFSETISRLCSNIIDQGRIQNVVNDIFLEVPEKQAKDFVSFILSENAPRIMRTKILILQNFRLTSEKFEEFLMFYNRTKIISDVQLSILLNNHKAMKERDDGYSSNGSSSHSTSLYSGSSSFIEEEEFGFDDSEENFQMTLSEFSKKYPVGHDKYAEGQAFVRFVDGLKRVTDDVKIMLVEYPLYQNLDVADSFVGLLRMVFAFDPTQIEPLKGLYDALCPDTRSSLNTFIKKSYDFSSLSQKISEAFNSPKKKDRHHSKEGILSDLKSLNSEDGDGLKDFLENNRALFSGHPRFMKKIMKVANEKIREAAQNPIKYKINPLYEDTVSTSSFEF